VPPSFSPPATDQTPVDYIPAGAAGQDKYYPSPQPIRTLMRRYRANLRAPNVFKLVDGSYTTAQPWEDVPGSVISFTYLGSHTYTISTAEAAALTAAGFGAGVTP